MLQPGSSSLAVCYCRLRVPDAALALVFALVFTLLLALFFELLLTLLFALLFALLWVRPGMSRLADALTDFRPPDLPAARRLALAMIGKNTTTCWPALKAAVALVLFQSATLLALKLYRLAKLATVSPLRALTVARRVTISGDKDI